MLKYPKISIITPSLNQGRFIVECIESVLNQNYENFEHIIIDGCSTDNTVEILKKYPHLRWISEPDEGQSDALNKALSVATGDIIGWLNADDYYCQDAFNKVVKTYNNDHDIKWIVGNLYNKYEIIDKLEPLPFVKTNYKNLISSSGIMRTQATFFKKELINSVGLFNIKLHMSMDYEMWLKMARLSTPYNLNEFLCVFRVHAGQKTTPANIFKQFNEILTILWSEHAFKSIVKIIYLLVKRFVKRIIKLVLIQVGIIDKKYINIPLSQKK